MVLIIVYSIILYSFISFALNEEQFIGSIMTVKLFLKNRYIMVWRKIILFFEFD